MKIQLTLFGCFSEFEPGAVLELDLADAANLTDVRAAIDDYGRRHWPRYRPGLLGASVLASESELLCDEAAVPADCRLLLLPPVCGG